MKHGIETYNRAGYPVLWLATKEPMRAVQECRAEKTAFWDILRGFSADLQSFEEADPVEAIDKAAHLRDTVVFLWNFHRFLENPATIQAVLNALPQLKTNGTTLVVMAPSASGIPAELEPVVRVLDHDLPGDEMLTAILGHTIPEGVQVDEDTRRRAVETARGLTADAFEDSLALSIGTTGGVDPETVWQEKADALKKTGGAEIAKDGGSFDDIGGLDGLKQFTKRCLTSGRDGARGVMLLGCPGTGKSMFAKALGTEVQRPTVLMDMGRMFGSLVGESERMIRETLAVVEKMAPCVLFIDEIEKGLSGVQSSGKTDGGTTARVFGTFLTWLNDRTSEVYVIATCNDISGLPAEFMRQERWDGVFFVDLPTDKERKAIWSVYRDRYGIKEAAPARHADEGWTGAEIKSACRLAHLQDISLREAMEMTVPLIATAGQKIDDTRKGASGRTLSAATARIFRYTEPGQKGLQAGSRKISQASKQGEI